MEDALAVSPDAGPASSIVDDSQRSMSISKSGGQDQSSMESAPVIITKRDHTPSGMTASVSVASHMSNYHLKLGSDGSGSLSRESTETQQRRGSVWEVKNGGGKPCYLVMCTSNDRLELTVTPTAVDTIRQFVEVRNLTLHLFILPPHPSPPRPSPPHPSPPCPSPPLPSPLVLFLLFLLLLLLPLFFYFILNVSCHHRYTSSYQH